MVMSNLHRFQNTAERYTRLCGEILFIDFGGREKHQSAAPGMHPDRIEPTTGASAPTGNQTDDHLVGAQCDAQTTEPHRPAPSCFLSQVCCLDPSVELINWTFTLNSVKN